MNNFAQFFDVNNPLLWIVGIALFAITSTLAYNRKNFTQASTKKKWKKPAVHEMDKTEAGKYFNPHHRG